MNQELLDHIREMQWAAYFRTAAEDGFTRVVDSPFLGGPIASAFERLSRLGDPVVEVARLGTHEVHNVVWGIDAVEDSLDDLGKIKDWTRDGAITIRHMAGGRC